MLKIEKIKLLSNRKTINEIELINKINYIFSPNSTGKTKLVELIDYLLGSSKIILDSRTFYGIDTVELVTNKGIFSRTVNGDVFAIKLRERDEFEIVNLEIYKSKIEEFMLDGDYTDIALIKQIADLNLSYRTFTIFNFLSQYHLGTIDKTIFTKMNNFEYYRAKYIFKYMFNKNNYSRIQELKNENAKLKRELSLNQFEKDKYDKNVLEVKNIFSKLGLNFEKELSKNALVLDKYINDLLSLEKNNNNSKNDYYYLMMVLSKIDNQRKMIIEQKKQSKFQKDLNNKRLLLLDSLNEFAHGEYEYISSPIKDLVEKCNLLNTIMNDQEFDGIIKSLNEQRKKIILDINKINDNYNGQNYEEKKELVSKAKFILESMKEFKKINLSEIDKTITKNNEEIRKLENEYDINLENKINEKINEYYSLFKCGPYDFINEDYSDPTFHLKFSYKKMSINGYVTKNDSHGAKYEVIQMIGSMARQTFIQICTYLAFIDVIKNDFQFPIMNTFIFDCVSKPFDDNNEKMVCELLKHFTSVHENINFLVTTDTTRVCDKKLCFELKYGLNPLFKQ